MTPVIRTEQLTKSYGQQRGIIDVDLDVEAGEVFGFLGPNGAGQDDDHPDRPRPHPPDVRSRLRLRHRVVRGPGGHPSARRLHPR